MAFHLQATRAIQKRVIVLGVGEVGFNVARRLSREGQQVVVVDRNPDKLHTIQNALDVQVLQGSASSPDVLDQAGVDKADIVVAVTGNDEVNLLACLVANIKNPSSVKLARVRNDEYTRMATLLGPEYLNIKAIINPEVEVVNTITRMLALPRAVDYGEFGGGRVKVIAIAVQSGPLAGKPLTSFPEATADRNVRVCGILRGENLFLPSGKDVVTPGDVVYFVCLEESLATVLTITEAWTVPVRHICIVGGGNLGLRLAAALDNQSYHVKLVDRDHDRCSILADRLARVTVLNGDGTDRDFMREENIGTMDMVIALTGDEETNILACLLAKSMGACKAITRVNKSGYMPIVRAIGLELNVNPRLAATNSIVHFLRQGMLLSTLATHDEDVEMSEAIIQAGSPLVGKSLREAHFPDGVNVLVVMRESGIFIPQGDAVLAADDRIILICRRDRIAWVERYVTRRQDR